MNKYLEASIGAFNVSSNCDRSSPEAFFNSYVNRKKKLINSKLNALKIGSVINQEKLQWEVYILEQAEQQRTEFIEKAKNLLAINVDNYNGKLDPRLLQRAEKLI